MITFLTGVPGSGKTYKAVVSIYNNFSVSKNAKADLKKDYQHCYTNINELKYEDLKNTSPLDFDLLKENLTELHTLYKQKVTDDILINRCKELNIYQTLFVIDEAHNIFDTEDKVLIWWLSYHRHLYHDIFLITQNLSLIKSKYKTFSEFFYKAKPTTVSLNKNTFKYDVYINSRMSMNARSHTEKISKNEEVFNLYHSGDSVGSKNVLLKFYIFSGFGLLFMFFIAYYIFGSSEVIEEDKFPKEEKKLSIEKTEIMIDEDTLNDNDYSENTYLKLYCSKTKCNDEVISIPPQLLKKFIDDRSINILHIEAINHNLTIYHLDTKTNFYDYIKPKKGLKNESSINEDGSTDNIISFVGGS